ncbi:MAG: M23 family metallopeptidase [Terracidiphilus sp.]
MRYPLTVMKIRPFQFGKYDPISNTFGKVRVHHTRSHQGWDLLAKPGTDVYAIADGELTKYFSASYGNTATLKFVYNGHTYYAFYAHLSIVLMANMSVKEGSVIGRTGMTGNARTIPVSEAHLHFEIRTVALPGPHSGIHGRIDPGQVLGFAVYSCSV